MLMVYSGDPPLFSLNSFSSVHRSDHQQRQIKGFLQTPTAAPTMHILGKAEELHYVVLGQLTGLRVSRTRITGAGKHMAPVLPRGIDTSVPYLQEETFLDAVEDTVGVFDLGLKGKFRDPADNKSRKGPSLADGIYLFVIQQTFGRGEADVMGF